MLESVQVDGEGVVSDIKSMLGSHSLRLLVLWDSFGSFASKAISGTMDVELW